MTMKPEDYEEFQRQLELEKLNNEDKSDAKGKTKVDEDGTEYEWDEIKKAWFPKLSPELLLKFQSNYNENEETNQQNYATYKDPQSHIVYNWNPQTKKWIPSGQYDPKNPNIYKDSFGNTYQWDAKKNTWKTKTMINTVTMPSLTEEKLIDYSTQEQTKSNIDKTDSDVATYTNPSTGIIYKWNQDKFVWVSDDGNELKPASAQPSNNPNANYYWDQTKNQWVEDTEPQEPEGKKEKKKSMFNKRKVTEAGLPPDITEQEFAEFMSKCGIIMPNPQTQQPKVKLYKDESNNLKGDGTCCYLKRESIALSMQLLSETEIRGGYKVKIDEAKFELKGNYDKTKKPRMMSRKEKKKLLKQNEKMLDWKLNRKEGEIKKTDRVLIFKNMFHPKEFEQDPVLITDIRDDLKKECEKFGPVKKVIVFDRHTDGVCSVAFKDFEDADKCHHAMNERWFAKRQIKVSVWDGHTDYQIEETDKEREARMQNWEKFLEADEEKEP